MTQAGSELIRGDRPKRYSGKNPPIWKNKQANHKDPSMTTKSQFDDPDMADDLTHHAWKNGTPVFDKNGNFDSKIFIFENFIGRSKTGHRVKGVKVKFNREKGIHGVPTGNKMKKPYVPGEQSGPIKRRQ